MWALNDFAIVQIKFICQTMNNANAQFRMDTIDTWVAGSGQNSDKQNADYDYDIVMYTKFQFDLHTRIIMKISFI